MEDLLDQRVEDLGDLEGERQARVVAAGLDGVDGLTRDAGTGGEVSLGPVALSAEDP